MIDRLNSALEGRYRIERELGQGGMATVYLAEDLKHHRNVALKVLKPELAAVVGAERFLGEIKTTAQLQHPHILPLHDSGEADGFLFYVMPYVEGDSLRERLEREHQLPVDEAVGLAVKVAGALHHAHQQGVVHRDIKPANILLASGEPLVADFGIALALSEAGGGRITETGLSLGTPHYMSPEQAAGERTLDKRSDVYALGCVLYEMLTGLPPYGGPTAQAVLGRILTGDPTPPTEHRRSIPTNVEHAVMRALERLPADRFDTAEELVRALGDRSFRHWTGVGAAAGPDGGRLRRWQAVGLVASLLVLALLGTRVWEAAGGGGSERVVRRHHVVLGSGIERTPGIVSHGVALHPRGTGILFADPADGGGWTYWWKATGAADAVRINNMDGATTPVFSPDGQWVAFVAGGQLRKQPLLGGTTVLLADSVLGAGVQALGWLEDGTLLFENAGPVIERVSEDGTGRAIVADINDVGYPIHFSGLARGGAALASSCTDGNCTSNRLYLIDLDRDTIHALADDVLRAWNLDRDRIVYVDRRGAVYAAELDRAGFRLHPPVPLFDGVAATDRTAEMQVGADGTLVYARGQAVATRYIVGWTDRAGRFEPVAPDWTGGDFLTPALSPLGDRLALSIATGDASAIWVKELPRGPLTRLTVENAGTRPAWSPDGRHVAYITNDSVGRNHARMRRADGTSQAPEIVAMADNELWEVVLLDDGGRILFRVGTAGTNTDVGMLGPDRQAPPTMLLTTSFDEFGIALSPDQRWLAYVSNLNGTDQVYVRPFPDVDRRRVQVSTNGGTEPVWAHSGREIFYRDGEGWMVAATVSAEPEFQVVARERLFDASGYRAANAFRSYDISNDDSRFLMFGRPAGVGGAERPELFLVENWIEELRAAVRNR